MPDGNRGIIVKVCRLVFGVAAFILVAGFFWQLGSDDGFERGREQEKAAEDSARSRQSIEIECVDLSGALEARCIREIEQSYTQEEQAARDLSAQNRMSKWALWMVLVSALMVGLTAWALWYIRRNLRAALDLAEDTEIATAAIVKQNELQAASNRPIMQLDTSHLETEGRPEDSTYHGTGIGPIEGIHTVCRFRNYGKQPCWVESAWIGYQVVQAQAGKTPFPYEIIDMWPVLRSGFVPVGGHIDTGGSTKILWPEASAIFETGAAAVRLFGCCQYRSPSGFLYCTRFAFHIGVGKNTSGEPVTVDSRAHWRDGLIKYATLKHGQPIPWIENEDDQSDA